MEPETYASYVDMATDLGQDSSGEMPADLCEVDPRGVVAEHEATITAIDAEATKAAKAAKAARAGDVTGAPAAGQARGGKGGPRGVRREAPVTGDVHADAEEPEAKRSAFDIGGGQAVVHKGDESWRIVGQKLRLHNSFWGIPVPPPLAGGGQLVGLLGQRYREAGVADVEVTVYPGARHEILNETNRDEVTANIIGWLTDRAG